jgi:hypothetical protein
MEEHDVAVRVKDGLYFSLTAALIQQKVGASSDLVNFNPCAGRQNFKAVKKYM